MKTNTYKSNTSVLFKLVISLLLTFFIQSYCAAKVAAPTPPSTNPHPPTNSADKARVDFATEAVKLILIKSTQTSSQPQAASPQVSANVYMPAEDEFFNKDLDCLKKPSCYSTDVNFTSEVTRLLKAYGQVTKMKHAHIIPWSYQNFEKNKKRSAQLESHIILADTAAKPILAEAALMKAPQLKPDEYMVHIYVQFDKTPYWHHLDVILSEDDKGNIFLRHFFVAPMMSSLPPGVIC